MQAITPALAAILTSHFQAGASGFRGRLEVDGAPSDPDATPTGTYPPIGPVISSVQPAKTDATGNIWYSGGNHPVFSDFWNWTDGARPDTTCYGLPFGYEAGGGDVTETGYTAPIIWFVFRGSGTATIHTGDVSGTADAGVTVTHIADTTEVVESSQSGHAGDTFTVTVGALPVDATNPWRVINLYFGAPNGGYAAFYGLDWAADQETISLAPKRISIDKSLRMTADQATVEFANEDLPLGWGPSSVFPTNSRTRIYQWFGDEANAVCTFTGVIDAVSDSRDVLTTSITCRDMMAILIDQTFGATAPQGADEDGNVRTEANGVYLSREISYIVADILDRAGWPTADRAITATSYVLDEFIIPDGTSWSDAIIGDATLTGLVGYDAWADELGVFHFAPTIDAGSVTDPGAPAYTFQSGVDILSLGDATDQYDLRTRVKVRGPLTTETLTDVWREVWRTKKIAHPVGIWYDPSDSANIRVIDSGTKRLYKIRQSDRAVLSSTYLGSVISHPLGISGDPSDASIYWVLDAPWYWGSGSGNTARKMRKSDNHQLASYALPSGHLSAIKVSSSYLYVTSLSSDRFYRRSKTDGTAVADYNHTYGGVTQLNPAGMMIDGSTLSVFWSNGGTTARFLQCAESAPGTITKVVKTAGTALHGGEMDTTTHTECWGDSDSLGLVAKFSLVDVSSVTAEVYAEVVDTALEDELGGLAESEDRIHDTHSGDAAHPFEIRRDTLDVTVVTSLAQATQTAMRRLDKLSVRRRVLDVGIIGNPALQKTDLVRVEDPVTGIADDWTIDTYRSEMAADSTYVGTLALLPVATPTDAPTDDGDAS